MAKTQALYLLLLLTFAMILAVQCIPAEEMSPNVADRHKRIIIRLPTGLPPFYRERPCGIRGCLSRNFG
ncbi:Hypothetical predicted protein [Cloeon dipterum]|uniref:Uncharacterized protein n=1 Tax=Cloeon dipterum TaxID=197152 RepID=A0A8S1CPD8_9INSE|nr:Hypothetical predicted protein [Cloeon dipterum]